MKHVLLITLISFFFLPAFSQNIPTIKASEAKSYTGKLVYLKDSIQSGKILSDSIAVLKVGGKLDKDVVSVIYLKKHHTADRLNMGFVRTLQLTKADFRGVVLPTATGFILIIDKDADIIFHGPFPE